MADETITIKDYIDTLDRKNAEAVKVAFQGAAEANKIAFDAANALLKVHNDVVRKAERDAALYVTRAQLRWAFGAVVSVLGMIEVAIFAWLR
jgi:hypothetical protein